MNEKDQEVEKCSQMHTQELNHRVLQHQQQKAEFEQTISLLKQKLETLQEQDRDQKKTIRDFQAQQDGENNLKDKIIERLEAETAMKSSEVEKMML